MNLFVTGTDTNIGKTVVSAMLALKLDWHYWKPIQTGAEPDVETDRDWVCRHQVLVYDEQYRMKAPLSPHLAAALEGIKIDPAEILSRGRKMHRTVIEGAGGLMVPVTKQFLMIDLIEAMAVPTVVVARSRLGTINHTLLSLEALRARRLTVLGVIMVGDINEANRNAIQTYGKVRVLAEIPILKELTTSELRKTSTQIQLTESCFANSHNLTTHH
jgi:dethiobiotin synthase